ncbi:MAG: hypothetical protein AAFR38_11195 [Planctomycetota bacterium]
MDAKIASVVIAGGIAAAGLSVLAWSVAGQFGPRAPVRSAESQRSTPAPVAAEGGAREVTVDQLAGGDGDAIPGSIDLDNPPPGAIRLEGPEAQQRLAELGFAGAEQAEADLAGPFDFERVSDAAEAASLFDQTPVELENAAAVALADQSRERRRSLIQSWRDLMRPLVAEDIDAFSAAFLSVGGLRGDEEPPGAALYNRLHALMGGGTVDLTSARIERIGEDAGGRVPKLPNIPGMPEMSPDAVPIMMMQFAAEDEGGETRRADSGVRMPLGHMFGSDPAAGPVVEVWAPVRIEGRRGDAADFSLSLFMTFDESVRSWRPVAAAARLGSDAARSRWENFR